MLVQKIIRVIGLACPLIMLCIFVQSVLASFPRIILCSLLMSSIYVLLLHWNSLCSLEKLQYSPNEKNTEFFIELIKECKIEPAKAKVLVKYAYANGCIAMVERNTIIIDPIVWCNLDDDQQAVEVKYFFVEYIEPTITEIQKKCIAEIRANMNSAVQRFIFKHELGHFSRNVYVGTLIVAGFVNFLATLSGILVALALVPINGLLAVLLGVFIGGLCEVLFTFTFNATWRQREEKLADEFAVQHSSYDDVIAAADFFVKHQNILDNNKDDSWLSYVPSEFMTGHPNGKKRFDYLLKLAAHKHLVEDRII